jgi:threonine-phosphate decarboxylase
LYQAGQPWSVSIPAQAAGIAALGQTAYLARTRELIRSERAFLREQLTARGFQVFGSRANFIFFRAPGWDTLQEELLPLGYLIRSCENFEGLDASFYRIAVRRHEENEGLLQAIDRLLVQRGGREWPTQL